MMRGIKFRIFNKHGKNMIYDTNMAISNMQENGFKTEDEHRYLMQFTGLTDRNGVEIYEGDIVDCFKSNSSVVVYKQNAYGLQTNTIGFTQFYEVHGYLEVIGNIYENPELLK